MKESARIDKWLWAARIYKTRSIAADACKNGRVRGTGRPTKKERRALDAFVDPAMFGFDEEDWDEEDS